MANPHSPNGNGMGLPTSMQLLEQATHWCIALVQLVECMCAWSFLLGFTYVVFVSPLSIIQSLWSTKDWECYLCFLVCVFLVWYVLCNVDVAIKPKQATYWTCTCVMSSPWAASVWLQLSFKPTGLLQTTAHLTCGLGVYLAVKPIGLPTVYTH